MIKTFNILNKLDEQVSTNLPLSLFKGYTAINKRGVEKLIDELYATLPKDVKKAREYLREKNIDISANNPKNLYDNIQDFENCLDKSFHIARFVIVNIQELECLLDKIYASIPTEIVTAKNIEKQEDKIKYDNM